MERDYTNNPTMGTGNDVWNRDTTATGRSATTRDFEDETDGGDRKKNRRVLSAGTLAGDRVRNSAGEDLGKIEELMIDVHSGRVAYAVLSFGGFLGMGSKLFALPWHALTLDEQNHEFIVNADKASLESAPGFDKDNWPDMADPSWGSQIFSHYGYRPYWEMNEYEDRDRDFESKTGAAGTKTFKSGGGL